ncbi:hypothetical protein BASA60_007260 [Batrachochytrium salamandrivorans]|nr:hypothetical protein BASA60_007260 [Batrachochytrium salamandrivorans]
MMLNTEHYSPGGGVTSVATMSTRANTGVDASDVCRSTRVGSAVTYTAETPTWTCPSSDITYLDQQYGRFAGVDTLAVYPPPLPLAPTAAFVSGPSTLMSTSSAPVATHRQPQAAYLPQQQQLPSAPFHPNHHAARSYSHPHHRVNPPSLSYPSDLQPHSYWDSRATALPNTASLPSVTASAAPLRIILPTLNSTYNEALDNRTSRTVVRTPSNPLPSASSLISMVDSMNHLDANPPSPAMSTLATPTTTTTQKPNSSQSLCAAHYRAVLRPATLESAFTHEAAPIPTVQAEGGRVMTDTCMTASTKNSSTATAAHVSHCRPADHLYRSGNYTRAYTYGPPPLASTYSNHRSRSHMDPIPNLNHPPRWVENTLPPSSIVSADVPQSSEHIYPQAVLDDSVRAYRAAAVNGGALCHNVQSAHHRLGREALVGNVVTAGAVSVPPLATTEYSGYSSTRSSNSCQSHPPPYHSQNDPLYSPYRCEEPCCSTYRHSYRPHSPYTRPPLYPPMSSSFPYSYQQPPLPHSPMPPTALSGISPTLCTALSVLPRSPDDHSSYISSTSALSSSDPGSLSHGPPDPKASPTLQDCLMLQRQRPPTHHHRRFSSMNTHIKPKDDCPNRKIAMVKFMSQLATVPQQIQILLKVVEEEPALRKVLERRSSMSSLVTGGCKTWITQCLRPILNCFFHCHQGDMAKFVITYPTHLVAKRFKEAGGCACSKN